MDIALKKLANPSSVTVADIEADIGNWSQQKRQEVFLLTARFVAADLINESERRDEQLALKCLKAMVKGSSLTNSELVKLASALEISTEELKTILERY